MAAEVGDRGGSEARERGEDRGGRGERHIVVRMGIRGVAGVEDPERRDARRAVRRQQPVPAAEVEGAGARLGPIPRHVHPHEAEALPELRHLGLGLLIGVDVDAPAAGAAGERGAAGGGGGRGGQRQGGGGGGGEEHWVGKWRGRGAATLISQVPPGASLVCRALGRTARPRQIC